jgi:hypothetical protein
MPALVVVWVFDTSSICEVRRTSNAAKPQVFARLTALVAQKRLMYPPEVLGELERIVDPKDPDAQFVWANENALIATPPATCSFDEVKGVLSVVPTVLDPNKDSGAEEADPYVLAAALKLREQGLDARVVTEERRDTPTKMSLNTACGVLGIPSLPLNGFLIFEKLL